MESMREPVLYAGEIDENIDLSMPPASGEEYIKRVIKEARQCADVVVADIDRTRLKKPTVDVQPLLGCLKAPPCLSPTLDWQNHQIADFSNVRVYVGQLRNEIRGFKRKWRPPRIDLPSIEDDEGWIEFCLGSEEKTAAVPTLNTVFCLNRATVVRVLEYLSEHIEKEKKIDYQCGRWVYALLVVLEWPLTPDACFCLRSLARQCSYVRALRKDKTTEARETRALNLFICLVGRYFRQLDMADT